MKKCLIFFIYLAIHSVFLTFAFAQNEVETIDVAKQCQQEEQYECFKACLDGWSMHCYYDSSTYKIENNQPLDSQKDKCYAYYDTSVCAPCRNTYQIDKKDVTCEEFYDSINEMNKKCNGCLRRGFAASG